MRLSEPDQAKESSPERIAGAIRAAVGRGAAGLIVEPDDNAVVVDALYEAVGRGVAVLLLDRPVPARGGKSIPHVEFIGFADVGRQVVAAVLEAARTQKTAKPGRIVFLHHQSDDPYLERASRSLLEPCQAAGKPMEVLKFDGDTDQGMAVLRKALAADPEIEALLADDAIGLFVGFRIHMDTTESGRPGFVLGGYTANDYRDASVLDRTYSIGERSVTAYASKTSQAIRGLMDARPVADTVEVAVTFSKRAAVPQPAAIEPAPGKRAPKR